MSTTKCPKCQGHMEEGYLMDQGDNAPGQSHWRTKESAPRKVLGFITLQQAKTMLAVTTFRCEKCGFLESYALEKAG
jgi:hypothetical protein